MNGKTSMASIYGICERARSSSLVRDTFTTTLLSTIGKGAGFLIPFLIAYWFGASSNTDSFFFAYGLIMMVAMVLAPTAESMLVPFVAELKAAGEDVGSFVGRVVVLSVIGETLLLAVFAGLLKPALSLTTGFSQDQIHLIYLILLESSPLVVLIVLSSVLVGAINAHKRFAVPALSPMLRALVAIFFIFSLKDTYGVHAIALGYVAGEALRFLVLFYYTRRSGLFAVRLSLGIDKKLVEFLITSMHQVVGTSALILVPVINKAIVSWLSPGSVTILEYAYRLYMVPYTFFAGGIAVTLLSHWSNRYQQNGDAGLHGDVVKAVNALGLMGILFTAVLFSLKGPIVNVLYGHGKLSAAQLEEVGMVFGIYVLGYVPLMFNMAYAKAFLVKKQTRILMILGLWSLVYMTSMSLVLVRFNGIAGVAMASSVCSLTSMFIMRYFLLGRSDRVYGAEKAEIVAQEV